MDADKLNESVQDAGIFQESQRIECNGLSSAGDIHGTGPRVPGPDPDRIMAGKKAREPAWKQCPGEQPVDAHGPCLNRN
jgi:hypothetical protein